MSPDGRYVLLDSPGAFVPEDTNALYDAYVKDLQTGLVERISVSSTDGQSSFNSFGLGISNDGRFVLFRSQGQLVPTVTNGLRHFYVRDRLLGTTELVDVTYNGTEAGNSIGTGGSISGDGRFVAFRTRAGNILSGMTNLCSGCGYVFVRDLQTQTTIVGAAGPSGNPSDTQPFLDLSDDGRYLTFMAGQVAPTSPNSDLVPEDTNGLEDVYRRDLQTGDLELVSVDSLGQAAGVARLIGASGDGSMVAFDSINPVTDEQAPGVYLRDLGAGSTTKLPVPYASTPVPSLSADASSIAFWTSSSLPDGPGLYVLTIAFSQLDLVTGEAVTDVRLSADGKLVGLETIAGLTPDDTTGQYDVYLADLSSSSGPVDADGDGVVDTIDTGVGSFDDGAGSFGSIVDAGGLTVLVEDALAPDGVRITVGSGPGEASFSACGVTLTVSAGSEVVVTCGSIKVQVVTGAARVVLGGGLVVVSVPTGVTAKVTDTGNGGFSVQNLGGGNVTVIVDGLIANISSGATSTVKTWDFQGFSQPVDNLPTLNVVKAGQAVPLKWRLVNATGQPVTDLATARLTVSSLSCSLGVSTDQLEEVAAGGSGLLNLGDGNYQLNWKTDKSYANTCKTLHLEIGDGVTHDALFKLTR
jgi:Tol biopolymer transport system component